LSPVYPGDMFGTHFTYLQELMVSSLRSPFFSLLNVFTLPFPMYPFPLEIQLGSRSARQPGISAILELYNCMWIPMMIQCWLPLWNC